VQAEAEKRGYRVGPRPSAYLRRHDLGALTIYSERPDAFDSDEVSLLSELADELSYGIMPCATGLSASRSKSLESPGAGGTVPGPDGP